MCCIVQNLWKISNSVFFETTEDRVFQHFLDRWPVLLLLETKICQNMQPPILAYHSERPNIHFFAVPKSLIEHFWCHIPVRACSALLPQLHLHTLPEVDELNLVAAGHYDILGFDISVADVVAMQVMNCLGQFVSQH